MHAMQSDHSDSEALYAIPRWGAGYFHVNEDGHLAVRPDPQQLVEIDLRQLVDELHEAGLSLPVLVRFNDILRDRVRRLRAAFEQAQQTQAYSGSYTTAYPIKVNQQRSVVEQIVADGATGLEAGSKPELMAALSLARPSGLVVCNGYKDREYIRLALIGRRLGLRLYIVIEKPQELELVLEESARLGIEPLLGVRVRLAVSAAGNWQNSGGERAKFGLSAAQLLSLIERLEQAGGIPWLQMLHVHLGSQIPNLADIRNGLREAARYFVELSQLGVPIDTLDLGGGLGVDYEGSGTRHFSSINYSVEAYAEVVVAAIAEACREASLVYPAIITESGRALTAHHSLLISNLIDREAAPGAAVTPAESDQTLPVLAQLSQLLGSEASPLELFEQAQELLDQARREFELGALSLAGRARAEQLFYAICRELQLRLAYSSRRQRELIERIHLLLADKLFLNFSLFQSMPDAWAIEQIFPVVPLQRLDEVPDRRGVVHDLTCDSDGCIEHYVEQDGVEASLPVHAPRAGEAYYLGIFLLGAYQEILGDIHNLFGDSDAVNLELDGQGGYRLLEPERGDSVDELLSYVHFDPRAMEIALRTRLNQAGLDKAQRDHFFAELKSGLYGYTYLED